MSKPKAKRNHYATPAWLVRTVASVIIIIDIATLALVITGYSNIGLVASIIFTLGAISSGYMSIMALKTANPAWVLLDLIVPM